MFPWFNINYIFSPLEVVMRTSIAARMLQLLGLPTLLYQPGIRTNLEVTLMYTQVKVMVPPFFHCLAGERTLGFFKPNFYGFIRRLIIDEGKRNLL